MNELKLIRIAAEAMEIAGCAYRGEYERDRLKVLRKELKEIAVDYQRRCGWNRVESSTSSCE